MAFALARSRDGGGNPKVSKEAPSGGTTPAMARATPLPRFAGEEK